MLKTFGYVTYFTILIFIFSYSAMSITSKMVANKVTTIIEKSCVVEPQKESLNVLPLQKSK